MICYAMLSSRFRDFRERLSKSWADFIHVFRCVKYGLENLWAYIPILWHDRDWDHTYMLALWERKFRRMADLHTHHGHLLRSDLTAQQLRVCASLCKRIADDQYDQIPHAAHDAKWGKLSHDTKPGLIDKDGEVWTHRLLFSREKAVTPDEIKQELEESQRIWKHAAAQKAADVAYLTDLIRKNLLTWWD